MTRDNGFRAGKSKREGAGSKVQGTGYAPVDVAEELRLVLLNVGVLVTEHSLAVDPRHHKPLLSPPPKTRAT